MRGYLKQRNLDFSLSSKTTKKGERTAARVLDVSGKNADDLREFTKALKKAVANLKAAKKTRKNKEMVN